MISAPRRIGKTSILFNLLENSNENYHCIYVITQSVYSENEYYKRLYKAIVDCDKLGTNTIKLTEKTKGFLKNVIGKIKNINIDGVGGVEFNESSETNYKDKFIKLIKSLPLDGHKIILLNDEFTQAIENIIKKEGEHQAVSFLQYNREVRYDDYMKNNLLFIYTGSVGLENIVSRLSSIDLISDLNSIRIKPLKKEDATKFCNALLENAEFQINETLVEYMLEKIEWFIPFYIQLFIQEIDNIHIDEERINITKSMIDKAFNQMLEHRNHFEHWQSRLKKTFKKENYKFAEEILNHIARKKTITSNEILNLAVKRNLEDSYKDDIRVLVHDGYINNQEDIETYRFNSPILRTWWYKNVTN